MKLAISFGSGGARALGALGVVKVLEREGIKPAAVAGCSMGAIIAAYYALYGNVDALIEFYTSMRGRDVLSYIPPKFRGSILNPKRLSKLMKEWFGKHTFDDCRIPLVIITTDLHTGKVVRFTKGRMVKPIIASWSVPGIFPPVKIGKRYYVDGGVVDPTPIDFVKGMHVLALDFTVRQREITRKPTLGDSMMLSYSAARSALVQHLWEHHSKNVTMINPTQGRTMDLFRYDKSQQFIEEGERAAEELIRKWRRNGMLQRFQH